MTRPRTNLVLRILVTMFTGEALALYLVKWFFGSGPSFIQIFNIGHDYTDFYEAAGLWFRGRSPYGASGFVGPAPELLAGAIFHWLPAGKALTAFSVLTAGLVLAAMALFCRKIGLTWQSTLAMLLVTMSFGPFFCLLAGGNTDGLMVALLLFAYCAKGRLMRAVLVAASVVTKLYTGLVIVVLVRRRRYSAAAIIAAAGVLLLLPFWRYWPEMAGRLFGRTDVLRLDANISPAGLFLVVLGGAGRVAGQAAYWCFWLGTLGYALVKDRSQDEREALLRYIPWMITTPLLVYWYGGVMCLPVMAWLARRNQERPLRRGEWTMVAGTVLIGLYPSVFASLLPLSPEAYQGFRTGVVWLGALGGTLLLAGAAVSAGREDTTRSTDGVG